MKNYLILIVSFIFVGCASTQYDVKRVFGDKNVQTYNGTFSGTVQPNGCRSSEAVPITGNILDGKVHLSLVKNQTISVPLSETGSFKGEAFLRTHARGKKMQSYTGQILDGEVTINAWYGVHGASSTYCTALGKLAIKTF